METLLENTMNVEHVWMEGDATSPDCQDDETVDDDQKVSYLYNACCNLILTDLM